jgi:hypothetical protein
MEPPIALFCHDHIASVAAITELPAAFVTCAWQWRDAGGNTELNIVLKLMSNTRRVISQSSRAWRKSKAKKNYVMSPIEVAGMMIALERSRHERYVFKPSGVRYGQGFQGAPA